MPKPYSVQPVQSVSYGPSSREQGYGFNIVNASHRLITSFSFATKDEADNAAELVSAAIESAEQIRSQGEGVV